MAGLNGKVLVVTGASSGIGRALCLALAEQRPRLVLAARDAQRLGEVAAACEAKGADVLVVPTDVSSQAECRRLVESAVARFKAIDVLVNNAGIGMLAAFDQVQDLAGYETLMKVNYLGSVYPTYYALPELKKTGGQIVTIASVAGLTGVPQRTAYSASKHALFGFFDSLRIELAGTGVGVTMVAPDFVVSEIQKRALGPDGQPLGQSPLKAEKIMSAERCAGLIVRAIGRRQRLLITSWRGRLGRFAKLVAPGLVDGIARRAVERGH